MSQNKTPFKTAAEAEEARIRAMGFYAALVAKLAASLAGVKEVVAEMQESSFPDEYGILTPITNLERAATIQVEPKIAAFGESYKALLADPEPEPEPEDVSTE